MTPREGLLSVRVELGDRAYDILIGEGVLAGAGAIIAPLAGRPRAFVLTDSNVAGLHLGTLTASLERAGLKALTHVVAPGEGSKSWDSLGVVLNWLIGQGAGRADVLVALGGGIVGDLGGLAAGLMKRGMRFVQVPTTLLSQVDSSVGGKTAVNTTHGKNLVGMFFQPQLVLADISALATLPEREWRAGFAEVIKYGLIDDLGFFDWLDAQPGPPQDWAPATLSEAVARSCQAKARIVAADETETGVRQLLNLGHTFGHALEKANGFAPSLLHGEAVGVGMAMAYRYSHRLGLCSGQDSDRAERVIRRAGLATRLSELDGGPYRPDDLLTYMGQDKKVRAGRMPLILARGIGQSFIRPDNDTADILDFLRGDAALQPADLP